MALTEVNSLGIKDGEVKTADLAADAVTGAKIADDAIDSEHYTDGSIDTAHIADDQVTLAKMAGLARGKIIVGDSSGNPVALAAGSNDQVLTMDANGDVGWEAASGGISDVVSDTSPQLGGDLDTNSFEISLDDSHKVKFGDGSDLEIYHNGTNGYIKGNGAACGAIEIDNSADADQNIELKAGQDIYLKNHDGSHTALRAERGGAVHLYHNNVKQCETTATGLKMQAPSGSNCILEMWADNAENNNDGWQINCEDNNSWNLHSYEDGAWERRLHVGAGDNGSIQMCWVNQADITDGGIYLANASIASKFYAVSDTTNSIMLFVNGNGTVGSIKTVGSATQFNTSSDYRLKENEVPLENAITKLKALKPYTFNFKKAPSEKIDGFYAHEAAEVVPVAVTGTKDEMAPTYYKEGDTIPSGKQVGDWTGGYSTTEINPQGIDYGKFTPLLTKALQEAIAKIETLETKVAALEAG